MKQEELLQAIKQKNINRKTEEIVYSQIELESKVKREYFQLSEELKELLDILNPPTQVEDIEN